MSLNGGLNQLATTIVRRDYIRELPNLRVIVRNWLNQNHPKAENIQILIKVDLTGYLTASVFFKEKIDPILEPRLRCFWANFNINDSGNIVQREEFGETVESDLGHIDDTSVSRYAREEGCWELDLNKDIEEA